MNIKPFVIRTPDETMTDLKKRLEATRWPDSIAGSGWDYGTDLAYIQTLVDYWLTSYSWREQERTLNQLHHFTSQIDGLDIHFVMEKSTEPDAVPIVLLHGWPDSFYRFYKLIPKLTAASLTVIAPSIPGFGFSSKPQHKGYTHREMADTIVTLMHGLGYAKFVVHGGDVGAAVAEQIGMYHADSLLGLHLTEIPFWRLFSLQPDDLSDVEKQYLKAGQSWQLAEGAYGVQQATKPQTLSYGLNDSPVGLLAWQIEKFRAWSDCHGDIETSFSKEELLTNTMLYWITGTIGSSMRIYYEAAHNLNDPAIKITTPTSVSIFPSDIVPAPRAFAERFYTIKQWHEMSKGGHFAALEEPDLLVDEIVSLLPYTNISTL